MAIAATVALAALRVGAVQFPINAMPRVFIAATRGRDAVNRGQAPEIRCWHARPRAAAVPAVLGVWLAHV
jgi:hypothetical protein